MSRLIFVFLTATFLASATAKECDDSAGSLMHYERQVLQAANAGKDSAKKYLEMDEPLACILKLQSEGEGMDRYLSASFLRPLLGGYQTPGTVKDPRYQTVAKALEQLALRSNDAVGKSFVSEFSRGDWRFYTLFCEKGDTGDCIDFLPDEKRVKSEAPLLAAASMLRLRQAYRVLSGKQRDRVAQRLKNLYREIPQESRLQRKFIDQIYQEIFQDGIPLSMMS